MRTTITIDDALYEQAVSLAEPGMDKPADIFREAIKTYVRVQAGRRLAALGGGRHRNATLVDLLESDLAMTQYRVGDPMVTLT